MNRRLVFSIAKVAASFSLALALMPTASAAVFSSTANGNYGTPATWGTPSGEPDPDNGAVDTVTFNNAVIVNVVTQMTGDSVTFAAGGSLIISNNNSTTFAVSSMNFTAADSTIGVGRATSGTTANHKLGDNNTTSAFGGGRTLSVINGNSVTGGAAGTLIINGLSTLSGNQTFNIGTAASAVNVLTLAGAITELAGGSSITKLGAGSLVLNGVNNYTGNTTISEGSFTLSDNAALAFKIGANGVNNSVGGAGTASFDGDFTFDLSTAATGLGNSWNIVNVAALSETFTDNFTVTGFTANGAALWDLSTGGRTYQFSETTGNLTVVAVPETSTGALALGVITSFTLIRRRHRQG